MRRWVACAAVGGGYLLLVVVLLATEGTGWLVDRGHTLRLVLHAAAYAGLITTCVLAWRRERTRRGALLGLTLVCWVVYTIGRVISILSVDRYHASQPQLADPGDALMLGAYALGLVGLTRLGWRSRSRLSVDHLIDAGVVTVAIGTLVWVTMLVPARTSPVFALAPGSAVVSAVFPAADLVLVALAVVHAVNQRPRTWVGVGLVTVPLLLLLGDALTFANLVNRRQEPLLAHVAWLLAHGCAAVTLLLPRGRPLSRVSFDRPVTRPARSTGIYLLGLVPAGCYAGDLVLSAGVVEAEQALALSLAMLAMFALLVARAAATMRRADEQSDDLEVMARSDHLTGLPNRRTGDAELARAVQRATRTGEPLCVAILDLDRFKAFNDTYGHHAGDELLLGCAHRWTELLGTGETLARYGGEEFILIAPTMPTSATIDLVDRLRAVTPRGQSFSAGIATWRKGESPGDVVSRADEALYAAKANGRARTYLWESDEGDRVASTAVAGQEPS
ncbi:diguanylate cyclase domain-containing protein [Arsenicicoccus dermatophilus]|uniref:GGDEF domain-containing protein n=1 Tax=Arsenicicoccus dermatophilus TaxID=1076331 RepID=UPI003916F443